MLNRVLLVDDSKSARFALRKLLERTGLQVDVAESGEQALGYLESNHPDLIFMDHFMPGMDGFEAARAIKNRPDKSGIPIIMCTSKEGESYEREARDNGAVDILPKPATPSALSEVLDKLMSSIEKQKAQMQEQKQPVSEESAVQLSEDQPEPAEHPAVPTLDDVVVPVEKVRRIASESATAVVDQYLEQRLTEMLDAKVPQLRESVLSNFDKVAKLMLEESVAKEVAKAQQEMQASVPPPAPVEMTPRLSEETVASLINAQIQQLYEKMQREMNEQLAEIYSSIGELKSNQHLTKVAPELMEDILMRARDSATEQANETLLQVSEIAQRTAKQSADEVSQKASSELNERMDNKLAKALEAGLETARQEAAESAWKKIEEANHQVKTKIGKLYLMCGLSLIVAGAAFAGFLVL